MDIAWESARIRWGWAVVGLFLTILVGFVLWQFTPALAFAIFIYYAMRRVYRWLDEHLAHPDLTATVTLLVLVLPALAVVAYALVIALRQLSHIVSTQHRGLIHAVLQPYLAFAQISGRVNDVGDLIRVLT